MAELVKNGNMDLPNISVAGQSTNITNWTSVGVYGLIDMYVDSTFTHNGLPSPITQAAYLQTTQTNINQTIIFPTSGNYVLTFWTNANPSGFSVDNKLQVNVGSIVSQIISYTGTSIWIKYTVPFSVSISQLSQTLTFSPSVIVNSNLFVTGISIMAAQPPCFREGTLISCSLNGSETEVPIERLKEFPYLVKTLKHGFLPIHSIGKSLLHNPGNRDRIKRRLYKLSPLNYPEIYTPLYLTGCHGLLVPSLSDKEIQACHEQYEGKLFVTDGQYRLFACLDDRAEPYDQEGEFPIYHVALQSEDTLVNYGIYANGLLVESCSIWSLTEKHKQVELMVTTDKSTA